jgi:hypothetical protein
VDAEPGALPRQSGEHRPRSDGLRARATRVSPPGRRADRRAHVRALGATIDFLLDAGAFDPDEPGRDQGQRRSAARELGFNVPSLLGVASTAPYFHDGSAATLPDVFERHLLGVPPATIASTLNAGQEGDLIAFLDSIDGQTVPFRSLADDFRDLVAGGVLP